MTAPSVFQRLRRSLLKIGLLGVVALVIFNVLDFNLLSHEGYQALGPWGVVEEMADHVIFPLIVVFVPMMLAALHLIRTGLEPLDRAAARIDAATEEPRGVRVSTTDLPQEALPFVEAVNRLLDRRDSVAEHSEAFAADIAHELKTPIAIIALELERSDAAIARAVLPEIRGLNRLIEQLLTLAQLDALVAAPQPFTPVALADVAAQVIRQMAHAALRDGVQLALEDDGAPPIAGRAALLESALRNLVENAIRVTPRGGSVVISVHAAEIAVSDGGTGLSEAALDRLKQRFARADNASRDGAGLGLPIVARIAEMHGARLVTDPERRALRIVFPAGQARSKGQEKRTVSGLASSVSVSSASIDIPAAGVSR